MVALPDSAESGPGLRFDDDRRRGAREPACLDWNQALREREQEGTGERAHSVFASMVEDSGAQCPTGDNDDRNESPKLLEQVRRRKEGEVFFAEENDVDLAKKLRIGVERAPDDASRAVPVGLARRLQEPLDPETHGRRLGRREPRRELNLARDGREEQEVGLPERFREPLG